MGLDQYLTKRTYVKHWNYEDPDKKFHVSVARGGRFYRRINPERVCEVIEEVAYWRKANAIHAWFVKHVQGGVDDCGTYYVSRGDLAKLREACDKVLVVSKAEPALVDNGSLYKDGVETKLTRRGEKVVDTQIAETVLPTRSGFFFGSVGYDDGYLEDLKYTSETIAELLAEDPEETGGEGPRGDYYYQASW